MIRFLKLFSCFLSAFLLLGCGEDFFDSVTEIEIPEHEPQLVVRGGFNANYLKYGSFVKVSHTLGILDSTEFNEINDATVQFYEEDILKSTFEEYDNSWYRGEISDLKANTNYTLKVSSPTYGNVAITQQLPNQVAVTTATYEADAAVDRYGDRGDEVTIQFQDPAGEQNYYAIDAVATYRFENPDTSFIIDYSVYASPVDPLLEDLDQLYLTDASFDGEMYTTRISIELMETIIYNDIISQPIEAITVRLTSISEDRYLFQKTLSAYQDNQDNPFAEPVVVHENIEGGSGIFTLSVTDKFSIDL